MEYLKNRKIIRKEIEIELHRIEIAEHINHLRRILNEAHDEHEGLIKSILLEQTSYFSGIVRYVVAIYRHESESEYHERLVQQEYTFKTLEALRNNREKPINTIKKFKNKSTN